MPTHAELDASVGGVALRVEQFAVPDIEDRLMRLRTATHRGESAHASSNSSTNSHLYMVARCRIHSGFALIKHVRVSMSMVSDKVIRW